MFGAREGVPVKPNPQVVADILQLAHTPKENVLYVGDSDVDMQTAQNASLRACAVLWGFRSRTQLEPYHPACWAERPDDILAAI